MVLNYHRDQAAADEVLRTVQALGVPAIAVQADLSRVANIERLFAEAQKAFGCLVIVVANNDTKALVTDAGWYRHRSAYTCRK